MQREQLDYKGRYVAVSELLENCVDAVGERFVPLSEFKVGINFGLQSLTREQRMAMSLSSTAVLSLRYTYTTDHVLVDTPLLHMESDGCYEIADRMQRRLGYFVKNHWPPQTRASAVRFLTDLVRNLDKSLVVLNEICVICDKPLEFPGLKPSPCANPLCVFAHDEMHFRQDAIETSTLPKVHLLIVILARASILSAARHRLDVMLSTIPTEFTDTKGTLDYDLLKSSALEILPSNLLTETVQFPKGKMTKKLFRWLLATNRATIFHIQPEDRIEQMACADQFQICLSGITAEKAFYDLKQKYGSFYAFHGSPFHNWYGIIRNGLKSYSNTNLMTTGAAHGPGIYLAVDSNMSAGYSRACESGATCMALCEVANIPSLKNVCGMFIVNDDAAVSVRFLFFYSNESIPAVKAQSLELHPTVQTCELLRAELARGKTSTTILESFLSDRIIPVTSCGITSSESESESIDFSAESGDDEDDGLYDVETDDSRIPPANMSVQNKTSIASANAPAQLRLLKEIKMMSQYTRTDCFEASPLDDDLFHWRVKLWLKSGSLAEDMKLYAKLHGRDYLELTMEFPSDYPTSPPFVWLRQPVLEYGTGFVSRGAICTDMLLHTGTKAAWSPVYTIDTILVALLANFQDSSAKGRIRDIQRPLQYARQEAKDGWSRAKSLHGW